MPTSFDLTTFAVGEVFAYLLVFCRVGSAIMIMPGVGDAFVSPRVRLLFALGVTACAAPVLQGALPPPPATALGSLLVIAGEIGYGLFVGMISRILIATIHTAGMIIATQSSLASAMLFDPAMGTQGTVVGNFLSLAVLLVLFTSDMHHGVLIAAVDSYTLFRPGAFLPMGDFSGYAVRLAGDCFLLAVQLSAPIMVLSLVLYFSAGILNKLMPTMQVFFVMVPLQILLSFFILMASISAMMLVFTNHYQETLSGFLQQVR